MNAPANAALTPGHLKGDTPPGGTAPLWLLALLAFSGTLAMHVFVPALPVAQQDLGGGMAAMQLTISLYILGLAGGQLVYGPLADRFGRRPVLLAGLSLYTVAGLAAMLAPSVNALIAARLFQALGGCAGLVLARAIVRDTSAPADTTRRLALMNLMITVGPGAAPLVGGFLADAAGWRSIFIALTLLGVVNLLLTWRLLPETGRATEGAAIGLMESYGQLLRAPAFWGYAVGGGCATTSLYGFVAAAPFIFTGELHQPTASVGGYIALLVLGVWVGSMLASRLIARVSVGRLLVGANGVSVAAAFILLAVVLSDQLTVPLAIATVFIFSVGVGTAAPAALAEALSVNPRVAGSASGLYGAMQMAVGALCTALAGVGSDPALAAALVLAGSGIIAQAAFWIAGRPRRAAS
ncbi:multidrug effflux MFS transporter [Xanthobacter autotrophicus DSM 597]|uniref:multidrug effflux MFS transporter n=1 Tax=Xanthobacter wiegelii TaxID=3119913 RepID=UPI0037294ED3